MKVASIAVRTKKNGSFLWLRRKDSGKWTLPGGHFEEDETAIQAAIRELWEETGIEAAPSDLESLGSGKVGRYEIHSFLYVPDKIPVPHGDNDPDEEAAEFLWFDEPPSKPHVPHEKNVTLVLMGLAPNEGIVDLSPTGRPLTKSDVVFVVTPTPAETRLRDFVSDESTDADLALQFKLLAKALMR